MAEHEVWGFTIRKSASGKNIWPNELKWEATRRIREEGQSAGDVAAEIGAHECLVRKWSVADRRSRGRRSRSRTACTDPQQPNGIWTHSLRECRYRVSAGDFRRRSRETRAGRGAATMIAPSNTYKIYLATTPDDFRKGMDGLANYVLSNFDLDPLSGAFFVFRSKGRKVETRSGY